MRSPGEDIDRVGREAAFHDHAFEHGDRSSVDRFYAITRRSSAHYAQLLHAVPRSARVLEYGCGQGSAAFELASRDVRVTGIDISSVGVEQAQHEAASRGLVTADFKVMNAEKLEFDAGAFDVVCGSGILHHLDLERAFAEVARVLTDEGEAFFLEPLGHNPLINAYRRRTPDLRTADEHPLRMEDFAAARREFTTVEIAFFHVLALAAFPIRRTRLFRPALSTLDALDRALFKAIPPARKVAWIAVIRCRGPKRRAFGS